MLQLVCPAVLQLTVIIQSCAAETVETRVWWQINNDKQFHAAHCAHLKIVRIYSFSLGIDRVSEWSAVGMVEQEGDHFLLEEDQLLRGCVSSIPGDDIRLVEPLLRNHVLQCAPLVATLFTGDTRCLTHTGSSAGWVSWSRVAQWSPVVCSGRVPATNWSVLATAHLSLRPVPWHHVPGRSNLTLGHCTVDMIHCSYYQSLLITTIYIVLWRNVGYFSVTCSDILPWSNMLQWLDCFVSVFGACFNFQNKCLNLGTRHLIIWETF